MQELLGISVSVLVVETVIIVGVIFGWWYGARQLNLKVHHRAVYLLVLIHLFTVGLWMIPRSLAKLEIMIANPSEYWYIILHDTLGMVTLLLAILLVVVFLLRPTISLEILRRTRPVMILVLTLWIVSFVLGLLVFIGMM